MDKSGALEHHEHIHGGDGSHEVGEMTQGIDRKMIAR